jgi:hypothetical protein
MAQKNHQNCCNTQPRDAHRNENKSEIMLSVTMEGAKARGVTEERFQSDSYRLVKVEPVEVLVESLFDSLSTLEFQPCLCDAGIARASF